MSTPGPPLIWPRPLATAGQLEFWWRPPNLYPGDQPLTYYQLACSSISFVENYSTSVFETCVEGLTNNQNYTFTLAAANQNGLGTPAAFRSVQPGNKLRLNSIINAAMLTPSTAQVSWTFRQGAGEADNIGFAIIAAPSTPTLSTIRYSALATDRSLILSNFTYDMYGIKVFAINDAGWQRLNTTNAITLNTFFFTDYPRAITDVQVSSISCSSFTISYNPGLYTSFVSYHLNDIITIPESISSNTAIIVGLTGSTNYSTVLKANNNIGSTSTIPLIVSTLVDPPTPITNLNVSGATTSTFTVTWDGGRWGSTFWFDFDGSSTLKSPVSYNSTSVSYANLAAGTYHTIFINAINPSGSVVSPGANITTTPDHPSSVTITQPRPVGFTVNWSTSIGALYYNINAQSQNLLINFDYTGIISSPYTITNLTRGLSYNVVVSAVNVSGSTPAPAVVGRTGPAPPTNLAITSNTVTLTSFTITWTAGVAATSYNTYTDGTASTIVANTTSLFYNFTGLANGTTYTIIIQSQDDFGVTTDGDPFTAITKPAAPVNVNANPITQTGFTVNWTTVFGATSYSININNTGYVLVAGGATANSYVVTGLVPGATASVLVKSSLVQPSTSEVISTEASVLSVLQKPATPIGLQSSSILSTSFTLTWTASLGNALYYISLDNGATYPFNTAATSFNFTALAPGTVFPVVVKATNATGEAPSATFNVLTTPRAPINLYPSNQTQSGFRVNWTASFGATSYSVKVNGGAYVVAPGGDSTIYYDVTGLVTGSLNTIQVQATNASGSTEAASVSYYTLPYTPSTPEIPSSTDTTITITWDDGADNPGSGTTYLYYANGVEVFSIPPTDTTTHPRTATIGGLLPNKSYDITVVAVNPAGTSSSSTAFSGLCLWLDALDPNPGLTPLTNGATLSTWYDKSGYNNDTTTITSGAQVIYTTNVISSIYPGMSFTGVQRLTGNISIATQTMTVFVIAYMNSSSDANARLVSLGKEGEGTNSDVLSQRYMTLMRDTGATGFVTGRNNTYTASNNPPSYSTPYLTEAWFDGTNAYATVQKGETTTITQMTSTGEFKIFNYSVGSSLDSAANFFNGYIAEVRIYNKVLTQTDREKIEGDLCWKWGIENTLPTSHPFCPTGSPPATTGPTFGGVIITKPSPPTGVTVTNPGPTGFTVNWTNSATATSHDITATDASGNVYTYTGVTSPYSISNLVIGKVYQVVVIAVNGPRTTPAAPVTARTGPGAPTNLTETNPLTTSFTISWTGGTGATSYNVSNDNGATFTSAGNVLTYSFTGLTAGTSYQIIIQSQDNNLVTTNSLPFTAYTTPAAPANVRNINASQTGFTVTWNLSIGATSYYIKIDTAADVLVSSDPTVNRYVIPNGTYPAGTSVPIIVKAQNSVGSTSAASQTLYCLPSNITNLEASGPSGTGCTVSWSGGNGALSYLVYANGVLCTITSSSYGTDPRTVVITGLEPLTTYDITIVAINPGGTTSSNAAFQGLSLWLDALDPGTSMTNGQTLTTWYDKSGYGNDGTAQTGVSPITYNTTAISTKYPAFTFTGSQLVTGPVNINNTTLSMYAVYYMNDTSAANTRLLSLGQSIAGNQNADISSNSNTALYRFNGTGFTPNRNGGAINFPGGGDPSTYSNPFLVEAWYDGTWAYKIHQIGNSSAVLQTVSQSTGQFDVAAYAVGSSLDNSTSNFYNGYIAEVMLYNTVLSQTDRENLEGYISWKWGLENNLPTGHPWAPPTATEGPTFGVAITTLSPAPPSQPVIYIVGMTSTSFTIGWTGAINALQYRYKINGSFSLGTIDYGISQKQVTFAGSLGQTYNVEVIAINDSGSSSSGSGNWTQQAGPGTGSWQGFASSADGIKLVTSSLNGYIYTSADSGVTWVQQLGPGTGSWVGFASSADGSKLVTGRSVSEYIYTSANSGVTWIARTSAGIGNWLGFASSANGAKLVTGNSNNGYIYTSTDSGVTWIQRTSAGTAQWYGFASSADGNNLVTGDYNNGYIFTSTDAGVTWTQQNSAGTGRWYGFASSADGTNLVTGNFSNGYIYTSSNSGVTWTLRANPGTGNWQGFASSADGRNLVTGNSNNGYVYVSTNGGVTWTLQGGAGTGQWLGFASSTSGTKLVTGRYNTGYIYTYDGPLFTLVMGPPATPTLTSSNITQTGFTVNWSGAGGVITYTYAISPSAGTYVGTPVGGGSGYVTWIGLSANTSYTVTITAANSLTPPSTASISVTTIAIPVPTRPILYVSGITSTSFTISWTGGDVATSYTYKINGATTTPLIDNGLSAKNATFSGSINNTYSVEVIATNGGGSTSSVAGWIEQTGAGTSLWCVIASSEDGTKLVTAKTNNDYIYTSTDSGVTWIVQTSVGRGYWQGCASSADGTKLVIGGGGNGAGYIYTSTNSGVTWTQRTGPGTQPWGAFASSADGTKLVAGIVSGYIYTSTNSGVTWTAQQTSLTGKWFGLASDSTGQFLVTGDLNNGYIYTSSNSGVTWILRTDAGTGGWRSFGSSSDGTKLIAANANNNSYIYTSTNSGVSWTARQTSLVGAWQSCASSSDGTNLVIGDSMFQGGYIYMSTDSGVTWIEQTTAGRGAWIGIASSADGRKLVACKNFGYIYTYAAFSVSIKGPTAPTLSSSNITQTGFTINWTGATLASSYSYAITPSAGTFVAVPSGTSGSVTWSGLTGGTAYSVVITATNNIGSTPSSSLSVTTTALTAPTRPDLYLSALTSTTFTISWTGGDVATSYTYIINGTPRTPTINNGVSAKNATFSGSINNTYRVEVIATNAAGSTSSGNGAWIAQTRAGEGSWSSIASSADGTKLAAINSVGSRICLSTDSGVTWNVRFSGILYLNSIASSADGNKLVMGDIENGYIYTSTDSGVTFTIQTRSGIANWYGVASSADGTKLIAFTYVFESVGYIYTSTDSGVNWTRRDSAGARVWMQIASSADGTKLVAGGAYDYIYTSVDSGASWTQRTSPGTGHWSGLASSSDGTKLVAGNASTTQTGGYIYTSTDSGVTWTVRTGAGTQAWGRISSSADGTTLVGGHGNNSYIYVSTNSGVSWEAQGIIGGWMSTASSYDGTKLVAGGILVDNTGYGNIWTCATLFTLSIKAPTAPTLSSSNITQTGFTINWTGATLASSYSYAITPSAGTFVAVPSGTTGTVTWSGLSSGTAYSVIITAINGVGSTPSNSLSVTTATPPPPAAPTGLRASGYSQTGFTINWIGVPGAASYLISVNGTAFVTAPGGAGATSYIITGLNAGSSNTVAVKALNGNPAQITVVTIPPTPINFQVTNTTNTTISLSWTASANADSYYISIDGGTTFPYPTSATTYTFTGLTPLQTYTFAIKSRNASGYSPGSATIQGVPMQPPSPTATNITASSFTINWTAVGATNYYVSLDNGATYVEAGNVTTYTFTGLSTQGLDYNVVVKAVYGPGFSISASVSVTTISPVPPTRPVLFLTAMTNDSFTIGWTGGRGATSYRYKVNGSYNLGTLDYGLQRKYVLFAAVYTGSYTVEVIAINSMGTVSSGDGQTWTMKGFGGDRISNVVSNSSGQYLAITTSGYSVNAGTVYTSSDYGITWVNRTVGSGNALFRGLAIDSTGQYLVAGGGATVAGSYYYASIVGYLYTSSDYGVSWRNTNLQKGSYFAIACSSSGQYIIAGDNYYGNVYISNNYGTSWTTWSAGVNFPSGFSPTYMSAISCDSTGQYMFIYAMYNYQYLTSSNYGVSWTLYNGRNLGILILDNLSSVLLKSDGTIIAAGTAYIPNGITYQLIKSNDFGATWQGLLTSTGYAVFFIAGDYTLQNLLTTNGIYIQSSKNGGGSWTTYPQNMPPYAGPNGGFATDSTGKRLVSITGLNLWIYDGLIFTTQVYPQTAILTTINPTSFTVTWQGATSAATPIPANLRLLNSTNNSITIGWTMGSGVDVYYVSVDGGVTFPYPIPGTNTFTLTNITALSSYTFAVKARSYTEGYSQSSVLITGVAVPVTVVNTSATNITPTSFRISWTASAGITNYYVSLDNGVTYVEAGNVTTYTFTGLSTQGSTYNVVVKAVYGPGFSLSDVTFGTPTAISSTNYNNPTTTSIQVTWYGSTRATSFTYRLNGNLTNPSAFGLNGTQYYANFNNLLPAFKYSVIITAVNGFGSVQSSPYLPQTANLILNLDAFDIYNQSTTTTFPNNTAISSWNDKTNNGSTAYPAWQSSSSCYYSPAENNSYPSIQINGTNYLTGPMGIYGNQVTIFVVANMTSGSYNWARLVSLARYWYADWDNPYTINIGRNNNTPQVGVTRNYQAAYPTGQTNYATYLHSAVTDGATMTAQSFVGNTFNSASIPDNNGDFYITEFTIGANHWGTDFLAGYVHEVLVYNVALTQQQRYDVEGYLSTKWGLRGNLYNNHPYRNSGIEAMTPA